MAWGYKYHNNWLDNAVKEIKSSYGHIVAIRPKSLHKFGRATSLGTSETEINSINQNETYVATNAIDTLSCSSADNTHLVYVEGMTISDGVISFEAQTATLNGQSKVTLDTPLYRVTRMENRGSAILDGDVYAYEDTAITGGVPDDLSKVHNQIIAADGQSLRAGTTIASNNYFIVTRLRASVNKKTSAFADIKFKVRGYDQTFLTKQVFTLSTSAQPFVEIAAEPHFIIPPRTDIYVTATCSTTGVDVSAGFDGYFADISG